MLVGIAFLETSAVLGAPLAAEGRRSHPLSNCSIVSEFSESHCPCSPPALRDAACCDGEVSIELPSLENLDPVFSGALGGNAFNERCVSAKLCCAALPV